MDNKTYKIERNWCKENWMSEIHTDREREWDK